MKTLKGKLKHGYKIGKGDDEKTHLDFELREYSTQDMFEAEEDAPVQQTLKYSAALIARQLVRIGTFEGPFTMGMVCKLSPQDFWILRKAHLDLETLGEA